MTGKRSRFVRRTYEEINLIADPIHGYIPVTWPSKNTSQAEYTEKDILDTPWLQRLRRIHQLQAVWWVFPAGEHTRFQHSLGAMHLGGLFASHIFDSLKENVGVDKSKYYVEELLRLAGLLHDIGHGPFCHFFDEEYLWKYRYRDNQGNRVNHEILGQKIIREELNDIITGIKRSPTGKFKDSDGEISLDHLCYLIRSNEEPTERVPKWVQVLKGLMTGVYNIDNLDYVWRDAYMCGVSPKPIDVDRIIHYTFTSNEGLVLYLPAVTALEEFLRFRFHMYSSVYYHRTVRAIELHMREIFGKTIKLLYNAVNPYQHLDRFFTMDDWTLLCGVQKWLVSGNEREKTLAQEWKLILERKTKWRWVHQHARDYAEFDEVLELPSSRTLKGRIIKELGHMDQELRFRVDLPQEDPRRLDPLYDLRDLSRVKIYNPTTRQVDHDEAERLARRLPAKSVVFRLYVPRGQDRENDRMLVTAFDRVVTGRLRHKRRPLTST